VSQQLLWFRQENRYACYVFTSITVIAISKNENSINSSIFILLLPKRFSDSNIETGAWSAWGKKPSPGTNA
jgi:hypothetical protein